MFPSTAKTEMRKKDKERWFECVYVGGQKFRNSNYFFMEIYQHFSP